jgi:hypothetical protein
MQFLARQGARIDAAFVLGNPFRSAGGCAEPADLHHRSAGNSDFHAKASVSLTNSPVSRAEMGILVSQW